MPSISNGSSMSNGSSATATAATVTATATATTSSALSSLQQQQPIDSISSLSQRLALFRQWIVSEAGATIHPALCIVNGEATDGTKNAPVLVSVTGSTNSTTSGGLKRAGGAISPSVTSSSSSHNIIKEVMVLSRIDD
jgi:hypothetical protein